MNKLREKATKAPTDLGYVQKEWGAPASPGGVSGYDVLRGKYRTGTRMSYSDPGPGFWDTVNKVWKGAFGKKQAEPRMEMDQETYNQHQSELDAQWMAEQEAKRATLREPGMSDDDELREARLYMSSMYGQRWNSMPAEEVLREYYNKIGNKAGK